MTSPTQQNEETLLQAFPIRHLSLLALAQGFTLWHYRADNAITFTTHSEWHGSILSMMAEGDRLILSAPNGSCDFAVRKQNETLILQLLTYTFWEA